MDKITGIGELFAARRLKREEVGGVERYVTGQHKAWAFAENDVRLSWVDNRGNVCICRAHVENDHLVPVAPLLRAGVHTVTMIYALPHGFELSKDMVAAVERAVAERFGDA